ncbi:radical SAM protein, partial [archaeon]|nr:radical SAM protein [archaeon]
PNMSLSYVAGALQKAGHDLIFLDAMASKLSLNDLVTKVQSFKAEILMFSITTYLFHQSIEIIKYFKERCKNVIIIVGGAHLGIFPKETLTQKCIDFGIIGEAEEAVVELIDSIENKKPLIEIKGICYRKNKKIIITKKRDKIKDLDTIAFPARNLLPMERYYSFISKFKNYTILMSSRGCTFQCIFCEQRTGDIRYRSKKNVVDEIEECYNKYHVKEIDIFDPLFTINKKRVIEICKEIQKRNINIAWSCRSRVDTIDEEMLVEMKKAGCYRIYFGIESGDEIILKKIKKFTKISQIKKAIHLTKKHKILAFGYFMFGNPGETKSTIENTINLSLSLPLDYAQYNRVSTLPGTVLYENLKNTLGEDYWKKYVKDKKFERALPRFDCNLSDEILNKYIKKAYMKFYFRPIQVFRIIKSINSIKEFVRYVKAGISMIIN